MIGKSLTIAIIGGFCGGLVTWRFLRRGSLWQTMVTGALMGVLCAQLVLWALGL